MAYSSWSVIFGEQPSAAKWNILGTNDAAFNDGSGILTFNNGGWQSVSDSWAYASVSGIFGTITVPSDATTKYEVGDWIRIVQSATTKYFQIKSLTATTLVVTGGTDYTLTNVAISSIYFSKWTKPIGAPAVFAFTTVLTGFSGTPGQTCTFRMFGNFCQYRILVDGTSNATTFTLTAPIAGISGVGQYFVGVGNNAGTAVTSPTRLDIQSASTTMLCSPSAAGNTSGWTNSGQKTIGAQILYQFT